MSSCVGVQALYDRLWDQAVEKLIAGAVTIDPYLERPDTDLRRGTTLLVRPDAAVIERVMGFMDHVRVLEPDQYYYAPEQLHVTVLSVHSARLGFDLAETPIDASRSLFAALLPRFSSFDIDFRGISASPGAVMMQGHVPGDCLNRMRERIRAAFSEADLGDTFDVRYRIVSAHSTLMRFRAPLRDPVSLLALLRSARELDFGATRAARLQFVANDWYMSPDKVELLGEYELANASSPSC